MPAFGGGATLEAADRNERDDVAESLLDELKWVHDMLRNDLAIVRRLAGAAQDGAANAEIQAGLSRLQTNGPLFALRARCLGYCRLVHSHHRLEDAALFPVVRDSAPGLTAALDRLVDDHRVVAGLLDEIEDATGTLDDQDPGVRARLVTALGELSEHLLDHLGREEEILAPVLRTWTSWPVHR